MLITVARVETKTSQKGTTYHNIYDGDKKYLSFVVPPAEGITVEAKVEPTKDGKGQMITGWEKAKTNTPQQSDGMSKGEWNARDRNTRQSIHRQSASDRGVALVVASAITIHHLPDWVGFFFNYYETGQWGSPPSTGLEVPETPKDTSTTGKAAPEAATSATGIENWPSLPNFGEFMFRCQRNDILPGQAMKYLGVVSVKELPADMTPDGAWLQIVEKCGKKGLKP